MNTPARSLVPEQGATKHSLQNGETLRALHGQPAIVVLLYDQDGADWYRAEVTYADGHEHTFTGFSWGYGGEGCRGLAEWAAVNTVPLHLGLIAALRNAGAAGEIWRWYRA